MGADRGRYSFESNVLVTPEPETDTRKFYYTANAIVNGIRRTGCTEGEVLVEGYSVMVQYKPGFPYWRGNRVFLNCSCIGMGMG